jgi:hypothetical protein
VASGGGSVGLVSARGHVPPALLEPVVPRKVAPARSAWVSQHRRPGAREAAWVSGVVAQDQTAIGRHTSPLTGAADRFVLKRCQVQRAGDLGWHRINPSERVCLGARCVHVDSRLWLRWCDARLEDVMECIP